MADPRPRRDGGRRRDHRVSPADPCERRWHIAHSIAHHQLHSGNQLWKALHTDLTSLGERQAEDYATGLLIDVDEAIEELLSGATEATEYFGVPWKKIAIQLPLAVTWGAEEPVT